MSESTPHVNYESVNQGKYTCVHKMKCLQKQKRFHLNSTGRFCPLFLYVKKVFFIVFWFFVFHPMCKRTTTQAILHKICVWFHESEWDSFSSRWLRFTGVYRILFVNQWALATVALVCICFTLWRKRKQSSTNKQCDSGQIFTNLSLWQCLVWFFLFYLPEE